MIDRDEVARIASELPVKARFVLLKMTGAWQTLSYFGPFVVGATMKALISRGLVRKSSTVRPVAYFSTPLGLAVRDYLKENVI